MVATEDQCSQHKVTLLHRSPGWLINITSTSPAAQLNVPVRRPKSHTILSLKSIDHSHIPPPSSPPPLPFPTLSSTQSLPLSFYVSCELRSLWVRVMPTAREICIPDRGRDSQSTSWGSTFIFPNMISQRVTSDDYLQ